MTRTIATENNTVRHSRSRAVENVLVLQGGGSLGAFACGVFKAVVKKKINLDIVAGTSVGAINAAIIAGSKSDHPERDLEEFWMELAESNYSIIPYSFVWDYDYADQRMELRKLPTASINAALFGVPKMFFPRWMGGEGRIRIDGKRSMPWSWTYIYDNSPLGRTIEKYVDYRKISQGGKDKREPGEGAATRLIVTAVNVLTSEPLIFDSAKMEIQTKHLLASTGYPVYGFPWVEVEKGVYGWDGSLLSNTPVREIIAASPRNDKHIFIVENYPRHIDKLPSNMAEVMDRTRDIIFSDKDVNAIKISRLLTRQIDLIERLYDLFETSGHTSLTAREAAEIRGEYDKLVRNRGAEILSIIRIVKDRIDTPHLLKNADFSPETIKQLISEGERKTTKCIEDFYANSNGVRDTSPPVR